MTELCYILKVGNLYEVLKGEVESSTVTQKQMEDKITSLRDQLREVTEDFERQHHTLAKEQEAFCIETKQAIDEVKEKQEQTNEILEELTNTNAQNYRIPLDEGNTDISCIHSNCVERVTNIEFNTIGTILLECMYKNRVYRAIGPKC